MPANFLLAQVNVSLMRYTIHDNRMNRFVNSVGRINQAAEKSPGYVWRWQGENFEEAGGTVFGENKLVNISVWQDIEMLRKFVFGEDHKRIMQSGPRWFARPAEPNSALWWIDANERPTVADAKERLDHLIQNGPTEFAFTFRSPFAPNS